MKRVYIITDITGNTILVPWKFFLVREDAIRYINEYGTDDMYITDLEVI